MSKFTKEILKKLKKHTRHDPDYKAFREKTTQLTVLGLRLPVMQEIEKNGFAFYALSDKEILATWNAVWNDATTHEVMYLPLFYYRRHKSKLDKAHWNTLKSWVNRLENWEHADALCYLYSFLYETHPKLVEPTLRQWNTSKNSWKRRASIVSTIYYASKNRKAPPLKIVLSLIEPLLKDNDEYVQKAVGWQLRECYNLHPEKTLAFIKKHLTDLSAISFSYATEKLSKEQKAPLKERRKVHRKKEKRTS